MIGNMWSRFTAEWVSYILAGVVLVSLFTLFVKDVNDVPHWFAWLAMALMLIGVHVVIQAFYWLVRSLVNAYFSASSKTKSDF